MQKSISDELYEVISWHVDNHYSGKLWYRMKLANEKIVKKEFCGKDWVWITLILPLPVVVGVGHDMGIFYWEAYASK